MDHVMTTVGYIYHFKLILIFYLATEILMTEDNQKRLIVYVADIALGDQRCDVEQLFGAGSRGGYSRKAGGSGTGELDLEQIIAVLRNEPFHIFDYPAAFDENELEQVLRRAYDPRLDEYGANGRDAEARKDMDIARRFRQIAEQKRSKIR